MTARQSPQWQRPVDHVRPLPASVVGRGTADGDPNAHLVNDDHDTSEVQ
jgi:hypothetical protein